MPVDVIPTKVENQVQTKFTIPVVENVEKEKIVWTSKSCVQSGSSPISLFCFQSVLVRTVALTFDSRGP